jgi:hypothetical protein
MAVDYDACLRRGAIGALGAIPGTVAAHPFDVVKMRMQVSGDASVSSTVGAIRKASGLPAGLYRGVVAGVGQKIMTRGPMFLASEVATQLCVEHGGLSRDRALFVGSFASGYVTGSVAASAEWAKVQRAVAGAGAGASSALGRLSGPGAWKRLHGAGLRNATFDSIFFGSEHAMRKAGLPPEVSYAVAAVLGMVIDFPLDAAVKRSMATPVAQDVRWPVASAWRLLRTRGLGAFAGLRAKACEFGVSYCVTGAVSRWGVLAALDGAARRDAPEASGSRC